MKPYNLVDRRPVMEAFKKRTRGALRRMGIDWRAVLRHALGKRGDS